MKKMKRRWDEEMPEKRFLTAQCLRDNVTRLNKEKELMNLILVQNQETPFTDEAEADREILNKTNEMEEDIEEDTVNPNIEHIFGESYNESYTFEGFPETEEGREEVPDNPTIEQIFGESYNESYIFDGFPEEKESEDDHLNKGGQANNIVEIKRLFNKMHKTTLKLDINDPVARKRLPKINEISECNKLMKLLDIVMKERLQNVENLNEVADNLYTMGLVIAKKLGINTDEGKVKGNGKNRKQSKNERRILELRQRIAQVSNELHISKKD